MPAQEYLNSTLAEQHIKDLQKEAAQARQANLAQSRLALTTSATLTNTVGRLAARIGLL